MGPGERGTGTGICIGTSDGVTHSMSRGDTGDVGAGWADGGKSLQIASCSQATVADDMNHDDQDRDDAADGANGCWTTGLAAAVVGADADAPNGDKRLGRAGGADAVFPNPTMRCERVAGDAANGLWAGKQCGNAPPRVDDAVARCGYTTPNGDVPTGAWVWCTVATTFTSMRP